MAWDSKKRVVEKIFLSQFCKNVWIKTKTTDEKGIE